MKRLFTLLLCVLLSAALIGCTSSKENKPKDSEKPDTATLSPDTTPAPSDDSDSMLESTEPDTTTAVEESTTAAPELPPDIDTPMTSPSLVSLRQSMVGTSEMFAVAYLGYYDGEIDKDPMSFIQISTPQLLLDLPFIAEIPKGNIVGGDYGEIYCIVPLDENATLSVNTLSDNNGEVEEVLYRSEIGDPIILICNGAMIYPNAQINIVDNQGKGVTWYPECTHNLSPKPCLDSEGNSLMSDFTPVAELLKKEYTFYSDNGWKTLETVDLAYTSFTVTEYSDDARELVYSLDFGADTVDIRWNDGIDQDDHTFTAPWTLKAVEGVVMLEIDLGNLDGVRSYGLLISSAHDYIYICQDFVNDDIRDYEPLSRVMERVYG